MAGDQNARTGDADTGIAPIFDADQVKQDVQAQAAITQAFGSQASQLVGDLAQAKLEEAQDKRRQAQLAQSLGDSERAAQLNAQADQLQQEWGDTGTLRLAAHTAIGALTGGTAGATGAAVGTLSASAVADTLNSAGLDGSLADSLIALASTAAGSATGGTQGGAAAFNEVVNNYLSHNQLSTARDELAACDGDSSCMAEVVERYQATSQQQDEAATDACATDLAACQEHSLAAADGEYARYGDDALWDLPNEALPYMLSLFDENIGVQNAFGEATIARLLSEGGISPELAAMPVGYNKRAANTGHFNEVHPRNIEEAKFLANAQATFANSSTWSGVIRHRDELVVQRSDIELSPQNITRMRNGQAPFVRNVNGDWELLHLHHVERQTGKMIEVTRSQNRYHTLTGGPLHIPGPGGPVRQPGYTQSYWQNRYQDFVNSVQIDQ